MTSVSPRDNFLQQQNYMISEKAVGQINVFSFEKVIDAHTIS